MGNKQNKDPLKRLNLLKLLNYELSGVASAFQQLWATSDSGNYGSPEWQITPKNLSMQKHFNDQDN